MHTCHRVLSHVFLKLSKFDLDCAAVVLNRVIDTLEFTMDLVFELCELLLDLVDQCFVLHG